MDMLSSSPSSARLYALLLKLRPLECGTLMPFSGELVHAAFLDWVRVDAPEVAEWLHEGNKLRLFTCSSLRFPLPTTRVREAERENTHLPLDPTKIYTVRVTLLRGELFPLLYEALLRSDMSTRGTQRPFMRLGKQAFALEEVVTTDASGWTGFTSYDALVEHVQTSKVSNAFGVEFASLTAFSWTNKTYGNYYANVPLPAYIFPMLAKRWQVVAPSALSSVVQPEHIEHYVRNDGMILQDYELHSHIVTFPRHPQRGFVGTSRYMMRRASEDISSVENTSIAVQQQILLLARFAFYSGIGYKTAMGMGQVRVL